MTNTTKEIIDQKDIVIQKLRMQIELLSRIIHAREIKDTDFLEKNPRIKKQWTQTYGHRSPNHVKFDHDVE